jgi:hypothetical protein
MLFRTSKSAPEIPWCSAVSAAHQKCSHKGIYPGKQYADARISILYLQYKCNIMRYTIIDEARGVYSA